MPFSTSAARQSWRRRSASVEAVSQWDEIPEGRQWQLYAITAGQLMPDEPLVTKTPELLRPNIKPAA